jgi:hypothetical protein
MILVRDVFRIKFGKAKPALASIKSAKPLMRRLGYTPDRILTDFTGEFYTLVMESKFKSLAEYERAIKSHLGSKEWRRWYERFVPLAESGRREIFNIVQL